MKILHTADWHLNKRLGRVQRQPDIAARLREIARYLDEYAVDVMLVAGDFLSDSLRYDEIESAFRDVHTLFKPFLLRGGTILALSGNHDTEALFSILRLATDLASPIDPDQTDIRPPGRLYLASRPSVVTLADKSGLPVQFVLMPYPRPESYLDGRHVFTSTDERNRILQQAFGQRLNEIEGNPVFFDKRRRSVLVTHIYVRGITVDPDSRRELSEAEEIQFNVSQIPTHWDYVAAGHIHRAQAIGGMEHVRYSGSVERLDAGERADDKSVVLFEIGPSGLTGAPALLPLAATPIYHVEIDDPDTQLAGLKAAYPDHEQAVVSYRVTYTPGGAHPLDQIIREVEQIFPRAYRQEVVNASSPLAAAEPGSEATLSDIHGTVTRYLESRLKDDPDRDEILRLAAELLANQGEGQ